MAQRSQFYFIKKETGAHKDKATCLRPHSQGVMGSGFDLSSSRPFCLKAVDKAGAQRLKQDLPGAVVSQNRFLSLVPGLLSPSVSLLSVLKG